jgi:hypothetical protein
MKTGMEPMIWIMRSVDHGRINTSLPGKSAQRRRRFIGCVFGVKQITIARFMTTRSGSG